MSVVVDSVVVVAQACEAAGGNGLGDQYVNPTGECKVSAFHVQLALAGGITDPFHLIFKLLMTITWAIYQFQIIGLAWITDFVLGMTWLDWFTDVVSDIQDSVAGMLSNLNLYLTMLVVSAFVCVIWMARGMWGKGLLQLLISLVIANYALAAISYDREHPENNIAPFNPVAWIIGNNEDGLLYDARDTARYLVGSITNDDDYIENLDDPGENRVTPGQSILDTFLYHPAMLVNFGYILEGECEQAYVVSLSYAGNGASKDDLRDALDGLSGEGSAADGVDTGSELTDPGTWWGGTGDEPVDYDPEVWKVVGNCLTGDVDTFAKAARPDSWMAQFAIQPAVTILAVLILIISGVVFIAGLSALIQCIKLLVTLLMAILPGGARGMLWKNLGQLLATVLMLIFSIVFLGVFLHVLTDVMAADRTPTGNPDGGMVRWAEIGKFLLIDLMLVAGIVLFWRGRGAVKETKEKMAAAMASKFDSGGGGAGSFGGGGGPGAGGGGADGALSRAATKFHLANDIARDVGDGGRLKGAMRKTGKLAGHVGLAWATGGGSMAAKGGAMAAKSTAVRGAVGGAGGVARQGAAALGQSGRNVAQSRIAAARRSRVGGMLSRRSARTRGRMHQFGAWSRQGGAFARNEYRRRTQEAGEKGWMPVDVTRRAAHQGRRIATEGAAELAGGRFGTAQLANRARRAEGDVVAGEVRRNYERRLRSEGAAKEFDDANARYKSAKAQADLRKRRHESEVRAQTEQRSKDKELRKLNRHFARQEWDSHRGRP